MIQAVLALPLLLVWLQLQLHPPLFLHLIGPAHPLYHQRYFFLCFLFCLIIVSISCFVSHVKQSNNCFLLQPTMGVPMLGKKPGLTSAARSTLSHISNLSSMGVPLSPPQTPLSPPPDYPGLEYPPVFEPGIYSLSDSSTFLSQSSSLYSPSSSSSSPHQPHQ